MTCNIVKVITGNFVQCMVRSKIYVKLYVILAWHLGKERSDGYELVQITSCSLGIQLSRLSDCTITQRPDMHDHIVVPCFM